MDKLFFSYFFGHSWNLDDEAYSGEETEALMIMLQSRNKKCLKLLLLLILLFVGFNYTIYTSGLPFSENNQCFLFFFNVELIEKKQYYSLLERTVFIRITCLSVPCL